MLVSQTFLSGALALVLALQPVLSSSMTAVLEEDFDCPLCGEGNKWANECWNNGGWKSKGGHMASCEFTGTDVNGKYWGGCESLSRVPGGEDIGCISLRGSGKTIQKAFDLNDYTSEIKVEFEFLAKLGSELTFDVDYAVSYAGDNVNLDDINLAGTRSSFVLTLDEAEGLAKDEFVTYEALPSNGYWKYVRGKFSKVYSIPEGPSGCGERAMVRFNSNVSGGARFYVYDLKVSATDSVSGATTCNAALLNQQSNFKLGGGNGDPHLKTWSGHKYDYHGECDLVLVDNPHFADGLGLKLHIRTTRVKYYSYIERAALQIGDDVLEFANDVSTFTVNGEHPSEDIRQIKLAKKFPVNRLRTALSVRLDHEAKTKVDFMQRKNGMMSVKVDSGSNGAMFLKSLGLIGQYETGFMIGRDNSTEIVKADDFAAEWQVQPDTDGLLFQVARAPQYPQKCIPPKPKPLGKRLGSSMMKKKAEKICAHHKKEDKDDCIFDVINTRDESSAEQDLDVEVEIDAAHRAFLNFIAYRQKKHAEEEAAAAAALRQ